MTLVFAGTILQAFSFSTPLKKNQLSTETFKWAKGEQRIILTNLTTTVCCGLDCVLRKRTWKTLSQDPRCSRCMFAKALTLMLTASQLSSLNGGQMMCELTDVRTPAVWTQVCISHLLSEGDQECPCWKWAIFMESDTEMRRFQTNKWSKTYQHKLLGTIEVDDAVGLHTLPTAFIWFGLHIFKALGEGDGVKSTPTEGNGTVVLGVWLECSYLFTFLITRQELTSYLE